MTGGAWCTPKTDVSGVQNPDAPATLPSPRPPCASLSRGAPPARDRQTPPSCPPSDARPARA
eukprot:2559750-Prymnesium_polylepis.1